MSDIEYGPIQGLTNAMRTQLFTLQDLVDGGVEKPLDTANPLSPRKVLRQARRLRAHPENYTGGFVDSRYQGYVKTGEWTVGYEKDFATEEEMELLKHIADSALTNELKLAIYGLVTNERLDTTIRNNMTSGLLEIAIGRAEVMGATAVNIILHKNDPVRDVALDHGFEFTGRTGRATNVRSIVQDLYSRPIIDE